MEKKALASVSLWMRRPMGDVDFCNVVQVSDPNIWPFIPAGTRINLVILSLILDRMVPSGPQQQLWFFFSYPGRVWFLTRIGKELPLSTSNKNMMNIESWMYSTPWLPHTHFENSLTGFLGWKTFFFSRYSRVPIDLNNCDSSNDICNRIFCLAFECRFLIPHTNYVRVWTGLLLLLLLALPIQLQRDLGCGFWCRNWTVTLSMSFFVLWN